ncbi:MAG TPA: hypothetical protein VFG10_20960 [Saprospiraceae bacterium]|nr:hypothetical protein [Saprospiraceae bacterium]
MQSEAGFDAISNQSSPNIPMIYIVGNSFCGSTLFGFLLGANPDIIFLGELKIKTWLKERSCSCGHSLDTCPFYCDYFTAFNDYKKSLFEDVRPRSVLSLLFKSDRIISQNAVEKMETFYHSISERISSMYPSAEYIVDSSKSIWMLNGWLHTSLAKNMKIIWITRPVKPSMASFVKRGFKFNHSLLSILVNNMLTKYYIKWNKLDYLRLDYTEFYESYSDIAKSVSGFLNTTIPSEYKNQHNHHVISGNSNTKKEFTGHFKGFHKDEEWKSILTKGQQKILSWFE